jgi:hypothetical protein
MLKITDLNTSKKLDSVEMAGVRGGTSELASLSALIDFSTSLYNKVADVNQGFGFNLAQGNSGAVTNNQTIVGGNGIVYAPVTQSQIQSNALALSEIGKTFLA